MQFVERVIKECIAWEEPLTWPSSRLLYLFSRVMDWHITALDLGVRQKRGSKPNYLGNRASLIAFSICGTASGQNRFATSRSIAASVTLHKTATVPGSIFTPFFNLKYTGEASLARFSRDSYCSVENSISGFTTGLYNTIG